MIISHKYKFIFVKTEKTAGTSIEIALSKYCGEKDVITPITPNDEEQRKRLGFPTAQNFKLPLAKYSKVDFLRALYKRKRLRFFNHASASFIKTHIDSEIWNSYYKFCFERNPFDKALSWYFYKNRTEPRPSIADFLDSGEAAKIRGFELYTENSMILVDRVFKYEELDSALEEITERLGLPEIPRLPRAKAGHRKDQRSYREVLSESEANKIARIFAREIAWFGYAW